MVSPRKANAVLKQKENLNKLALDDKKLLGTTNVLDDTGQDLEKRAKYIGSE